MVALVVYNARAGRGNLCSRMGAVCEVLQKAGYLSVLVQTGTKEEAEAIFSQIGHRPDLLVCAGGDGTLNETVNTLVDRGAALPLGYIPAGTSNDFAASLHIPKDPVKAAEKIAEGVATPVDLGRFGDRYFTYVASFGAFTKSSYQVTQNLKKTLGHLAYVVEGMKELPQLKAYPVSLETEDTTVEGEFLFGAVSNATTLGGVIHLDPEQVHFSDGLMEITLVRQPKNLVELNRIVFSLMTGKLDPELITFLHAKKARFTCQEPMPWSLDGEYAAGGEEVDIQIIPGGIQLVL